MNKKFHQAEEINCELALLAVQIQIGYEIGAEVPSKKLPANSFARYIIMLINVMCFVW